MRILILANNDGGLFQFRGMLINTLIGNGHDVFISLPNGEMVQPMIDMGCKFIDTPIDRRGVNPVTDFKLLRNYFNIVKKIHPDLVIAYTIKPNIYGGIACRIKKIPFAANITGLGTAFQNEGLLKNIVTALYKIALKRAKVIFFENIGNLESFKKLGINRDQNTYRLLNGAGVDLEQFKYLDYPENSSTVHFLFIGRVMKEKGIEELFSAMKQLRSEQKSCVLDILGYYEEDFSSVIEQYKSAGWLNYYGYQKDVRPFIEASHCFVLPSWHEGMANTNLECAASGRPLITSNIPGCREAVIEGESGFLCEAKNADSLYDAMSRFLSLTQEERAAMGRAGRQHMEQVFDKRMVVAETIKGLGL